MPMQCSISYLAADALESSCKRGSNKEEQNFLLWGWLADQTSVGNSPTSRNIGDQCLSICGITPLARVSDLEKTEQYISTVVESTCMPFLGFASVTKDITEIGNPPESLTMATEVVNAISSTWYTSATQTQVWVHFTRDEYSQSPQKSMSLMVTELYYRVTTPQNLLSLNNWQQYSCPVLLSPTQSLNMYKCVYASLDTQIMLPPNVTNVRQASAFDKIVALDRIFRMSEAEGEYTGRWMLVQHTKEHNRFIWTSAQQQMHAADITNGAIEPRLSTPTEFENWYISPILSDAIDIVSLFEIQILKCISNFNSHMSLADQTTDVSNGTLIKIPVSLTLAACLPKEEHSDCAILTALHNSYLQQRRFLLRYLINLPNIPCSIRTSYRMNHSGLLHNVLYPRMTSRHREIFTMCPIFLESTEYESNFERNRDVLRQNMLLACADELEDVINRRAVDATVSDDSSPSVIQNVHFFVDGLCLHFKPVRYQNDRQWHVGLVRGNLEYHHYKLGGIDDVGWGCAYRSIQTICSWVLLNGFDNIEQFSGRLNTIQKQLLTPPAAVIRVSSVTPSHLGIQSILCSLHDKPTTFLGSTQWIGSVEVQMCLQFLFPEAHVRILHCAQASELLLFCDELKKHFNLDNGGPVMLGGGNLALTILGVAVRITETAEEVYLLLLDPHYDGKHDTVSIHNAIRASKNGFHSDANWYTHNRAPPVYWQRIDHLASSSTKQAGPIQSNTFYNLCLISFKHVLV